MKTNTTGTWVSDQFTQDVEDNQWAKTTTSVTYAKDKARTLVVDNTVVVSEPQDLEYFDETAQQFKVIPASSFTLLPARHDKIFEVVQDTNFVPGLVTTPSSVGKIQFANNGKHIVLSWYSNNRRIYKLGRAWDLQSSWTLMNSAGIPETAYDINYTEGLTQFSLLNTGDYMNFYLVGDYKTNNYVSSSGSTDFDDVETYPYAIHSGGGYTMFTGTSTDKIYRFAVEKRTASAYTNVTSWTSAIGYTNGTTVAPTNSCTFQLVGNNAGTVFMSGDGYIFTPDSPYSVNGTYKVLTGLPAIQSYHRSMCFSELGDSIYQFEDYAIKKFDATTTDNFTDKNKVKTKVAVDTFDMSFVDDTGTKFYIVTSANVIEDYTLSEANNLETATKGVMSIDLNNFVTLSDSATVACKFADSGTKLFILNTTTIVLLELSTAYDLNTLSYTGNITTTGVATAKGGDITNDGLNVLFYDTGTELYNVTMSVAFSLPSGSKVTATNKVLSTSNGMVLSQDGLMFITADTSGIIKKYSMTTALDVLSASVTDLVDISSEVGESLFKRIQVSSDGLNMFVGHDDQLWVFPIMVANTFDTVYSTGEILLNTQNDFTLGATVPVTGVFSPDGSKYFYVNSSNNLFELNLTVAWEIGAYTVGNVLDLDSYDTGVTGLFFKPDGMRFFICSPGEVNQIDLSIGWDISSVTGSAVSTAMSNETAPQEFSFSSNGEKCYIVGVTSDQVFEYTLTTGWDITVTSLTDTFSPGIGDLYGIEFDSTGALMYLCNNTNIVYSYNLSSNWLLSSAVLKAPMDIHGESSDPLIRNLLISTADSKFFYIYGSRLGELLKGTEHNRFNDTYIYNIDAADNIESNTTFWKPTEVALSTFISNEVSGPVATRDYIKLNSISATSSVVTSTARPIVVGDTLELYTYAQVGTPKTITINNSGVWSDCGLHFYSLNNSSNAYTYLTHYQFSSPFDVRTSLDSGVTTFLINTSTAYYPLGSLANLDYVPTSITISNDGTIFTLGGQNGSSQTRFSLNTPFMLEDSMDYDYYGTSGTYLQSAYIGGHWTSDGTTYYTINDAAETVYKATTSTPFDGSSLSAISTFTLPTKSDTYMCIKVSPDESKFLVVASTGSYMAIYAMSAPGVLTSSVLIDTIPLTTSVSYFHSHVGIDWETGIISYVNSSNQLVTLERTEIIEVVATTVTPAGDQYTVGYDAITPTTQSHSCIVPVPVPTSVDTIINVDADSIKIQYNQNNAIGREIKYRVDFKSGADITNVYSELEKEE